MLLIEGVVADVDLAEPGRAESTAGTVTDEAGAATRLEPGTDGAEGIEDLRSGGASDALAVCSAATSSIVPVC